MRGLSLAAASGGHSSSRCAGLSLSWPLLLLSTGSRRAGSVIVAHGPSCSAACGISPDQGSNPCPLHWQADSQPLCHQGSPCLIFCFYFCVFVRLIMFLDLGEEWPFVGDDLCIKAMPYPLVTRAICSKCLIYLSFKALTLRVIFSVSLYS